MIVNMIKKDRVLINPDMDFYSIIKKFILQANKEDKVSDTEKVFNDFLKRESEGSFEVLPHVLIPHVRSSVKEVMLFIVISKEGIYYKGVKSNKFNLLFFVMIPEEDNTYVKILASISRILKNDSFLKEITKAEVFDDIIYVFKKYSVEVVKKDLKTDRYLVILSLNREVDEVFITTCLAEAGVALVISLEGINLGGVANFLSFMSSFFMSHKITKYNKTYFGLTDDPDACSKIYSILKSNKIDINENNMGLLTSVKVNEWYGGYSGIDF